MPLEALVPQVTARSEQMIAPARSSEGREVELSAAVSKTTATLTVSAATVTAGGTVTVTIEHGPAAAKDRVMFYSSAARRTADLDWKYLNGERTAPSDGLSTAVVTLTAPSAPGRYVVRLMTDGESDAIATIDITVVAAAAAPHDTLRIQR